MAVLVRVDFSEQIVKYKIVLFQAWQAWKIYITHLHLFKHFLENPEGDELRGMELDSGGDKIHSLDVTDLWVIARHRG